MNPDVAVLAVFLMIDAFLFAMLVAILSMIAYYGYLIGGLLILLSLIIIIALVLFSRETVKIWQRIKVK